ncbi:MAG TPA: FAD-dependent oxidoreductase, partial [Alphaproteobacteria bacterium]
MSAVHIVGAGLSGLAAAVRLSGGGNRAVHLHEGAGQAGGRCRSFYDETLGCSIDNGNHLLLSGNRSAMSYLREIGAEDTLYRAPEAIFPFIDLRSGLRWRVRPNRGRIPWWIFDKRRRVPDTTAFDYLTVLRLAFAGSNSTVAACVGSRRVLYERFWEPLAVAALNTAADEGASRLLWPVVMETFGQSGDAARPCMAKEGLSTSFVDPALEHLSRCRAEIAFN